MTNPSYHNLCYQNWADFLICSVRSVLGKIKAFLLIACEDADEEFVSCVRKI